MLNSINLNIFKSVQNPRVLDTMSLGEIFHLIMTGGNNLTAIEEARNTLLIEGNKTKYAKLKATLPCTNYGFTFNGYRNNENILEPTGLLAIDADKTITQVDHKYIVASFRSLSTKGMTYIIRVDGLNIPNYRYNYEFISKELGIVPDMDAGKATQPFVLPFSKDIKYNPDAHIIQAYVMPKKTHFIPEKKERVIGTELGSFSKVRFSNLKDYISSINFDGEAIYDFKEKFEYASLYVPATRITEGSRNKILTGIAFQFRSLNPCCTLYDIQNLLHNINLKFAQPSLSNKEIKSIAKSIYNIAQKDLVPILNDSKRFIFNSDYELTLTEKRSMVMTLLNKDKAEKTQKSIAQCIEDWSFSIYGKITQRKLATVTGKDIKTVKKYYPLFKDDVKFLNDKHKPP